jgi:hypothetical protein
MSLYQLPLHVFQSLGSVPFLSGPHWTTGYTLARTVWQCLANSKEKEMEGPLPKAANLGTTFSRWPLGSTTMWGNTELFPSTPELQLPDQLRSGCLSVCTILCQGYMVFPFSLSSLLPLHGQCHGGPSVCAPFQSSSVCASKSILY